MKNKNFKMIFILLSGLFYFGCKSTGQFTGTANLTILIIDESGCGVRDCALTLSNFNKDESGITNANGICIFNNIPSGEYKISAVKKGYTKLEAASFNYISKGDVFCFELYSSSFAFNEVEELYEDYDYKRALELLDQIVCDKKTSLYAAICLYKAYGYFMQENKKAALSQLNRMKKADKAFEAIYEKFITKISLPEGINEGELESENEKEEAS